MSPFEQFQHHHTSGTFVPVAAKKIILPHAHVLQEYLKTPDMLKTPTFVKETIEFTELYTNIWIWCKFVCLSHHCHYLLNLLHIFRFAISKNIYIDIYMYKYGIPISYSTIYIVCTNMEFQKISIYIVLDIYLGGSRFHRYPLAPRSKSCSSSKPCPLAPARPVRPKRWMYSLAQRGTPLDHQLMGLILWIVPSGKLT